MAKILKEIKTLDERKESLLELGKTEGYITFEQLAEALKGLDVDNDALDELYNFLIENGITVVASEEVTKEDENSNAGEVKILNEEDLTKDININDPVRMYLKEIGRISFNRRRRTGFIHSCC